MQIDSLYLRGFRNYQEAEARFVPGVNLIVGSNANGKTNLLEAISYLSTGHAFRTRKEQELIRFGDEFAEMTAKVTSAARQQELRALLFTGRRPRQLWLNGVKQKTAAGIVGVLPTVLFCPEDLLVLKKAAAPRRRLLDTVISQLRPNYDSAISEYSRLLEQKSALLRDARDFPRMLGVLPDYNARMAQVGALVISYRARFLKALNEAAAAYHREFSGDRERLELHYKTVSNIDDPFAPVDLLRAKLAEHQESHARAELDSAQCLSGPHKDDFEAMLNGLPMAQYASQGQTRTATISIKLAEAALLRRDLGEEPVLLLDDVLSELDAGRQDFVLNQLRQGQVFITCCETDRWTQLGQTIRIENGTIAGTALPSDEGLRVND
ncbi:MAG: DNA replication/repair protein RecF [Oscillospiraceae bacterium]|nr:DNA replication/repair protein RecF [Oscillospiraceae bacterium]